MQSGTAQREVCVCGGGEGSLPGCVHVCVCGEVSEGAGGCNAQPITLRQILNINVALISVIVIWEADSHAIHVHVWVVLARP